MSNSKTLDFYFDYSSPFGYLASERIEAIAAKHDRTVVWHPLLLGAIFKVTGQAPLTHAPLKGEYSVRDFSRSARELKIAYIHPENFPISTVAACRATLWMRDNESAEVRKHTAEFLHAVYRAYFAQSQDITDVAVLADLAESTGVDGKKLSLALSDQAVKDALHREVEAAITRQVFGSPMMIVDDEPFWGHDRLEQLDRWLEQGGW